MKTVYEYVRSRFVLKIWVSLIFFIFLSSLIIFGVFFGVARSFYSDIVLGEVDEVVDYVKYKYSIGEQDEIPIRSDYETVVDYLRTGDDGAIITRNEVENILSIDQTIEEADKGKVLRIVVKPMNNIADSLFARGHIYTDMDEFERVFEETVTSKNFNGNLSKKDKYSIEVITERDHLSYLALCKEFTNAENVSTIVYFKEAGYITTVLEFYNKISYVIILVLVSLMSALSYFLSWNIISPIKDIEKGVNELVNDNFDYVVPCNRTDEIGSLAESLGILGRRLKKIDSIRIDVFSNVSHELKSPLVLIRGYAEMVRDVTWRDEEKRVEQLNHIESESIRMSNMVSQILDYAQFTSGAIHLKESEFYLYELACDEYQVAKDNGSTYNILVRLDYNMSKDTQVVGDVLRISQVFRNLLNNAVNNSYEDTTIIIDCKQDEDGILVSIKNQGDEIPAEDRELLFERYYKVQHISNRREGTGIGLAIVKSIFVAHGFEYSVYYEDGYNVFDFRIGNDRIVEEKQTIDQRIKEIATKEIVLKDIVPKNKKNDTVQEDKNQDKK